VNTYAISALIAKRAEIAGKIEHHQAIVDQLRDDLAAVDQTLRLFKPGVDLDAIKPKRVTGRMQAFKVKTATLVLTYLKEANGPVSTNDLTARVMEFRKLDATKERLVLDMRDAVGACLKGVGPVDKWGGRATGVGDCGLGPLGQVVRAATGR